MPRLSEDLPVVARVIVACAAGLAGFALTGGLILLIIPFEGWSFLASFVAAPSAAIALMPFSARLFCFGLGLLAVLGTWFMDVGGPDNAVAFVPFSAMCFVAAAVVAEACVRAGLYLLRPKEPCLES